MVQGWMGGLPRNQVIDSKSEAVIVDVRLNCSI